MCLNLSSQSIKLRSYTIKCSISKKTSIAVVLYHRSFYVGKVVDPFPLIATEYGLKVLCLIYKNTSFSRIWMVAYLTYPHINVMINHFPLVDPAHGSARSEVNQKGGVTVPWGESPVQAQLGKQYIYIYIYIFMIHVYLNLHIYIYNCWMFNCQLDIQQKTIHTWIEMNLRFRCCKSTCRLAKVNFWEDIM